MRIKILRISVKQYTEKDYNGVDETVLQSRCTIEDSKTKEITGTNEIHVCCSMEHTEQECKDNFKARLQAKGYEWDLEV